jgi:hypothetical protein
MEDPPFIREVKRRGRRAEGLRYERRVHQEFLIRYPGYLPSPWFSYRDRDGLKWCQPDGLIIDAERGTIGIVEVKYQHTEKAYAQLFSLYLPILRVLFGGIYKVACIEVVKWYDCAVLCPVNPILCEHPQLAREGLFNVHIYKP